ncbi:hypothetical protein CXB51_003952 [Gossypium anomalum]|uniref:Indole-3-acetic acid-amido synthetase GH3.17 n=1 Tax=Gossypium anomalum TaxID=47600 RepID=A0A8J5ZHS4_9ROSI|nr:hypothetical protein CXB51_003952 [Gossypium anomalum]
MATNGYEGGLKMIEELTTNAEQIQDEVLREILSRNAGTEYLRGFLHGQTEKQLFKKNVPIVTYEDLKPYIDRIANGETSDILLAEPVTGSGTSGGQPKLMPVTAENNKKGALFETLGQSLRMRPEIETPSGLKAASVSTSVYNESKFRTILPKLYTSPIETIFCPDPSQGLYCQLLLVGSLFASTVLRGIKFLENHWQELCYDIKTGRLSDWITDSGCRNAASLVMKPNPEQADLIENICNCKSWEGIIRKLWPKARTRVLLQRAPFSFSILCLLGSYCGINLEPLCKPCDVSYTLLPNMAYFEFLPVKNERDESIEMKSNGEDTELVDLVNVKVGQCYELVVSTCAGLYRYKVGDVLMVSGKNKRNRPFQGCDRSKALLDPLGFILTEYTSYVDTSSAPGHYVLFWEIKGKEGKHCKELDPKIMVECCSRMEESLHYTYKIYRKRNIIAALEIRVVKQGSFEALMDYYVSKGTSLSQYKKPNCIKSEEALKILDSRVIGKYFSPKPPFGHESYYKSFEMLEHPQKKTEKAVWISVIGLMATNGCEGGLKMIEELTTNAEQIQDEVLREILSRNAGTEYLRGFLHGQTEKQLFKKNVPIVTYEDLKPYIDRIANGETSDILLAEPVTGSGTSSGQPKLMPVTAENNKKGALIKTLGQSLRMNQRLKLLVASRQHLFQRAYTTSVILESFCLSFTQAPLRQSFAQTPSRAYTVNYFLFNPTRRGCHGWFTLCIYGAKGIIRKLWPKARYIGCICTGVMRQYTTELEFYCRGLPLVSALYACSEAICGINLEPLCKPCDVSYTFLPNMAYFEFLPVKKNERYESIEMKSNDEDTELVDLVNVKVGQCYELVVSTCAGLYRYKVGDVLMVSGFYNNAPQFQFVERKNVILSVDQEKTSETDLFKAVTEAKALLDPLGFILTEYTSYVDTSSAPGHYVLFWEIKGKEGKHCKELDPKIMVECCSRMEESLHYTYKIYRKRNIIAALEIRVVKQGSFEALMDYSVSKGTALSQYKKPNCIKSEEALKILDSRVIGKYFSPKSPL